MKERERKTLLCNLSREQACRSECIHKKQMSVERCCRVFFSLASFPTINHPTGVLPINEPGMLIASPNVPTLLLMHELLKFFPAKAGALEAEGYSLAVKTFQFVDVSTKSWY